MDPRIVRALADQGIDPRSFSKNDYIVTVDTVADIPTDPGTYKVGSQLFVVGDDGKKRNVLLGAIQQESYENITPTHYFDPSAMSSSGEGTYANPLRNNDDLQALIVSKNRNMSGVIIGMKRGTTYNGYLSLFQTSDGYTNTNGIYAPSDPFIILPYGDAEDKPLITGCVVSTGWERDSTYPQLYKKAMAVDQEIYFYDPKTHVDFTTQHRYFNHTSISNLVAAGAGYACYSGGYKYIYPLDGASPNGGQTFQTNLNDTYYKHLILAYYANTASVGSFRFYGLQVHGNKQSGITITPDFSAMTNITSIGDMVIDGCVLGRVGYDNNAAAATHQCGVQIKGKSSTVGVKPIVTNNLIFHGIHNTFEANCTRAMLYAHNRAVKMGDRNIYEGFGSNNNEVVIYNYGEHYSVSTTFEPVQFAVSNGLSNSGDEAIWYSGWDDHSTTTYSEAKTQNNIIAFNHSRGNLTGAWLYAGSFYLVNNIFECNRGIHNVHEFIRLGIGTNSADVTLHNNAFCNNSYIENTNFFGINSVGPADRIRGNNNVFGTNIDVGASRYIYNKFRNTSYGSGKYADFIAAIQLVDAGAQSNTIQKTDTKLFKEDGAYLLSENAGKSLVNGSDGSVSPPSITDGAFGYRTDLSGELLTSNHIGCYQNVKYDPLKS